MKRSHWYRADPAQTVVAKAVIVSGLIHAISNRMTATGTSTYARFGLGFLEARILYVLPRSTPLTASQLAIRLNIHPAAISRGVNGLIERRLLTKGPGPKRNLLLTPEGLTLSEAVGAVFEDRCAKLIADLTQSELTELEALLRRLHNNLSAVAALADVIDFQP